MYPTSTSSKLPPDPYPTTHARFRAIAADNAVPQLPRPEPVFPYPVSKPRPIIKPKQTSYPVSHPKQDYPVSHPKHGPEVMKAILQGVQDDLEE